MSTKINHILAGTYLNTNGFITNSIRRKKSNLPLIIPRT